MKTITIFIFLIIQTFAKPNEYTKTISLKINENKQIEYPSMKSPQIIFTPSFIGEYSISNTETSCTITLHSQADQTITFNIYNTENGIKLLTVNTFCGEYFSMALLPIIPFLFVLCLIVAAIVLIKMIYQFIVAVIETFTDTFFNKGKLVEDYFNDNFGILPEDYFYLLLSQKIFNRPDEIARRFPQHNFETSADKRRREEKMKLKERSKCCGKCCSKK